MLAASGIVAAIHAPVAQAADTLSCAANSFYSVSGNGKLNHITNGGSNSSSTTNYVGNGWSVSSGDVNGLAIGANGTVAYAYNRTSDAMNVVNMLKYDSATG
jgi:hypothetical protein